MSILAPNYFRSAEAYRARSGRDDRRCCDGLRFGAGVMVLLQSLETAGVAVSPLVIRAGFVLLGYLLAEFLLADRGASGAQGTAEGPWSKARAFLRSIPLAHLAGVVAALLYLPGLLAVESIPTADLQDWPALIERGLRSGLWAFQRDSTDGRWLVAWPLVVLVAPRRLLGPAFAALLASGLAVQFSGLFAAEVRPTSILAIPSPLDLLAAGALVGAICQGLGRSGDGSIARWALLMGLALSATAILSRFQDGPATWGSMALLSAPPGFGAVNFILAIMATTLVASLAWRDLGR